MQAWVNDISPRQSWTGADSIAKIGVIEYVAVNCGKIKL